MKKLLVAAVVLLASSFAFANMELDLNLYGDVVDTSTLKDKDSSLEFDTTQGFAFGIAQDFNFYFGSRASKFDVGLCIFTGCDFFTETELSMSGAKYEIENAFGMNYFLGLGPVFRYTFSDPFSLYVRPGLGFDVRIIKGDLAGDLAIRKDATFIGCDFIFDTDVGGRWWFLNKTGMHMGLDFGMDFMFGSGAGVFTIESNDEYGFSNSHTTDFEESNRFSYKIYAGLCFNFGDRGIDR